MSRFTITELPLSGLKRITRHYLKDSRGSLARLFCEEELSMAGWKKPIAQINHTITKQKGTVRGLHFQRQPYTEMKLVCCIQGEIWDVAVDLRIGSPTFLQWHAEYLSADNGVGLLIPEGFAHGFQALSDDANLLYCHSQAHAPESEDGLNPRDPYLEITWPLTISQISTRDHDLPMIGTSFKGVQV